MKSNLDIALLLVRVGLALVFMAHGWEKVSNMQDTIGFFASISLPAFVAYAITYIELIGGFLMLIGVGTGWAGIALAATMVGSIGMVKLGRGFLGGYEFDLMLFLSSIAISLSGAGHYSAMRLFRKK